MKMPNRAACPAGGHLGSAQILLGRRNHHLPRVASFLLLHQSTYYKDLLPPSLPSSIDGQLGCFHLWSVLNNATMNIHLQVFVWIWFFFFPFCYIPKSAVIGPNAQGFPVLSQSLSLHNFHSWSFSRLQIVHRCLHVLQLSKAEFSLLFPSFHCENET